MSALLRTTEAQLSFRSGSFASLTKQAADKRADLAKLSGAAFDKAYIDNEIAYHKTVNAALQKTLTRRAADKEAAERCATDTQVLDDLSRASSRLSTLLLAQGPTLN